MTVLQTHHALQGFVFLRQLFILRILSTWWTFIERLRLSSGVTSTLKPSLIPPWVIPSKYDVSISFVCSDGLYASLYTSTHTLCQFFCPFLLLDYEQLEDQGLPFILSPSTAVTMTSPYARLKLNGIHRSRKKVKSDDEEWLLGGFRKNSTSLINHGFAKSRYQRLNSIRQVYPLQAGVSILTTSKEFYNLGIY